MVRAAVTNVVRLGQLQLIIWRPVALKGPLKGHLGHLQNGGQIARAVAGQLAQLGHQVLEHGSEVHQSLCKVSDYSISSAARLARVEEWVGDDGRTFLSSMSEPVFSLNWVATSSVEKVSWAPFDFNAFLASFSA